ncbi:MAG: ABC transporter substrate-binding protein [Vicinamibacterales bacterium]
MRTLRFVVALVAALALVGAVVFVMRPGGRAERTLVVGLSADITTFETANISSRDNMNIAQHIFSTLFTLDADGRHVPSLAREMEVSEDGLAYTYTLREGLTCHDGEPLTAEDVAYTFNRIADPANRFTGNAPGFVFTSVGFQGADAIDDLRVRIRIARKSPIAFGLLTEINIHCKDSYEKMSLDAASTAPVGSGPYRLTSWTRGSEIVLEKVGGDAAFDRIVWRIIPEASTRTAELIAGNVDIITNVAPDQIDAIDASGAAHVQSVRSTRRMYVGFNLAESFRQSPGGRAIQDPKVRRALQYAVDVPTICRQLLHAECERATGPVNAPNANPRLRPYPFEPATAERLLDEAGWRRGADGVRFPITLQAGRGRYLNDASVVQAIGQYLTDVGVAVEVELLEWASVYTPLLRQRTAGPLFFLGTGGGLWSAIYDMNDMARVDSGTNYTNWSDPRWFGRWDELTAAASPADERRIVDEMLQVFYDEGPWLLLYFQPDFYGVSSRVDWRARPDERVYGFEARPIR